MDVRILTQPTALQCRKDFSVGGGVTSKAAIFRGKPSWMGEISEMDGNGGLMELNPI